MANYCRAVIKSLRGTLRHFASAYSKEFYRQYTILHCNDNPIYVFLFWELLSLSPNFHIHVSVSDLYIPRIGPHISCSRIGKSIVEIYKLLTDTCMWKLGLWSHNSFSGNICFEFSVLVLCVVGCAGV
jgi:hypothetical protein